MYGYALKNLVIRNNCHHFRECEGRLFLLCSRVDKNNPTMLMIQPEQSDPSFHIPIPHSPFHIICGNSPQISPPVFVISHKDNLRYRFIILSVLIYQR